MANLAAVLAPLLIAQNGRGHTQRGSSHIAPARARSVGTRAEVMQGTAHHTDGGLMKADLEDADVADARRRRAKARHPARRVCSDCERQSMTLF